MIKHYLMIQEIVGKKSALGQKLKNFQQNGLLENISKNSEKPKILGLEKLSIEKHVDWANMKTWIARSEYIEDK